jgi:hypothetical protein
MIASLIFKPRFSLFFCLVSLLASPLRIRAADPAADADLATCKKNLTTIYNAIQSYRADHKDLPGYLSDLVPKYLKDPNVLICPTVRRTGTVNTYGIEDPNISTTYTYEFSENPLPANVLAGGRHTMNEWKRRQMSLVGSRVPMVRCHQHGQSLNISFDGKIYESSVQWEKDLKDIINPDELSAGKIFAADLAEAAAARAQTQIPPRDPKTPANLLDLSTYYDASLTEQWHRLTPSEPIANDLSLLPRGIQKLADVPFDIRGVVQFSSRKLSSPRYPRSIRRVKVDQKASRLSILQGTGWNAPDGTTIATLIVHYANGQKTEFAIKYGSHVIDWVSQDSEPKDPATSVLAWTGKSPTTGGQMVLHLYKIQWTNPNPDQPIATLDYLAADEDPAPFLIAITAE